MDFEGARALCEGVDENTLNENQFAYFFQRAVLAKAFVGLRDPQRASQQFNDVERRLERDGIRTGFCPRYPRSFITVWGNIACRLPNLIRREDGRSSCATTPLRHPIRTISRSPMVCWLGSLLLPAIGTKLGNTCRALCRSLTMPTFLSLHGEFISAPRRYSKVSVKRTMPPPIGSVLRQVDANYCAKLRAKRCPAQVRVERSDDVNGVVDLGV